MEKSMFPILIVRLFLANTLSAVVRPSVLLFLQIIAGPSIINALTRYINSCLGAVKLMVIKSLYEQVSIMEPRT